MGNVVQAGVGQAPARQAALGAGLPLSVPCTTVNKVCGSGLKSVMLASSQILAGEARCIVAGGMESMSNAPYLARGLRTGLALGEHRIEDANLVDGLVDAYGGGHMGLGGEKAAECCALTREDQDRFALRSYEKALRAQKDGAFDAEIVTVDVPGRKGVVTTVAKDETPRETSLEALAKLAPAFKPGGTVTAGNASKLNDGSCARAGRHADRARHRAGAVRARARAFPPRAERRDHARARASGMDRRLGGPVRGERSVQRRRGRAPRARDPR
jgi:acetyl-CoA C-acetyltransferase